jgi:SAM-dependent methyltransferase
MEREFLYNHELGRWWCARASDRPHARAYRNIADFIRASYGRAPRLIVDYACGAGHLLSLLSRRFTHSRLAGLDGSEYLLGLALRRFSRLPVDCSRRISLIKTPLPNLNLMRGRADLVIFCFPNMVPSDSEEVAAQKDGLSHGDREVARTLALLARKENKDLPDAFTIQSSLEGNRMISLNLRRLLVPGGLCVRVEYGTAQRDELSASEFVEVSYEEGSLDMEVEGKKPRQWFRVSASSYFRSRVLEDVYEQTGDERDRDGGYIITVLRAI